MTLLFYQYEFEYPNGTMETIADSELERCDRKYRPLRELIRGTHWEHLGMKW